MGTIKAPPLDEQLCFDLYAASRAVTAAYRPALTQLGITYLQYLVLIVLWEHESCTVSDLAAQLRLDHGTLTPLLKRLEAAGLVQRLRDSADERRVLLRLTPAGRALKARAAKVPPRVAGAAGCSLDELGALTRRLQQLRERVVSHPAADAA